MSGDARGGCAFPLQISECFRTLRTTCGDTIHFVPLLPPRPLVAHGCRTVAPGELREAIERLRIPMYASLRAEERRDALGEFWGAVFIKLRCGCRSFVHPADKLERFAEENLALDVARVGKEGCFRERVASWVVSIWRVKAFASKRGGFASA